MDVPMWFLHEVSAFWRKKCTFFSLNACPLEDKSPFLSFLGVTNTKPCSFWPEKVLPDSSILEWCHSYQHSGGMEITGIWISFIV